MKKYVFCLRPKKMYSNTPMLARIDHLTLRMFAWDWIMCSYFTGSYALIVKADYKWRVNDTGNLFRLKGITFIWLQQIKSQD